MSKTLIIKDKIKKFNKQIRVSGDKSLSIRWVLLASQAIGKSKGYNLLMSEDVLAAIDSIKKLGIKVRIQKNYCEILGNGINGFKYNKNLTIDAKNSGTLGRLILGLLIKSPKKIHWQATVISFVNCFHCRSGLGKEGISYHFGSMP